jgi:enoyl-CoA hydratase
MNNLKIKRKDAVALVIVDRPEKLNALNRETIEELSEALAALEADPRVRVLILTGSGNKAFVAGADISEFSSFSQEQGEQLARLGQEKLFDLLENMSKIVIGAINGFALGGGLELAMSCHFRYASETARMGLPEVTLGVIPGYGGTQRLPMLVGKGMAMDMLSTGRMIKADEALQVGLVNRLCAPEDLLEECIKTAQKIAANSSTAIAEAINAVNAGMLDRRQGYEQEKTSFGYCFGTADFKEGTEAFLSKRKPNFG